MRTAGEAIVLGPSDALPEVIRKVCASAGPAVALDISTHAELRRRPDLVRLLRVAAAEAGKDLQVTGARDGEKAAAARQRSGLRQPGHVARVGRGAADRGGEARRLDRASFEGREPPRSSAAFLVFAVAAGALLTVVAVFVLPQARVTVERAVEPLVADLAIALSAAATEEVLGSGIVPARHVVVEEMVEGTFGVETVIQRGERAAGMAAIVNRTSSPQGIKRETRLQGASGVVVRTQANVIVPAGGRASVRVRADGGGTEGNLSPQRLTLAALPSASQRVLFAEIVEPLTGGTDKAVREVAAQDIERAAEALRAQSETRLLERLGNEFGEGGWFDRPELRRVVLRDPVSDVPVGSEAEAVHMRASARGEALAARADAVRRVLDAQAAARAGQGKALLSELPLSDLRFVDIRWDELRAELTLHAQATVTIALSDRELKERLVGRTPEDAERFLGALPGVVRARVTLSPVWIRAIPTRHRNITITFLPEPAETP